MVWLQTHTLKVCDNQARIAKNWAKLFEEFSKFLKSKSDKIMY